MLSPSVAIASEQWVLPEKALMNKMVVDQSSTSRRFYEDLIKDKTVVINFVFSRCTASCSLSSAIFRQVQKQLGSQKVHLISISVDPVNDSAEGLLQYGQKFNAGPGWSFVSGDQTVIFAILKNLEAYSADKDQHSNLVIVGNDAQHRWTRLYGLPQAIEIIAALKSFAGESKNK